jgi:transposase
VSAPLPQPIEIDEAELLTLCAQAPQAVVALVMRLVSMINPLVAEVAEVKQLRARVEELESKASKNSRNRSKPPSSDGFGKRTKSLRPKSEKPSGGQVDYPGSPLEWQAANVEIESHAVTTCSGCGASLSEVAAESTLSRQVFDI